MKAAIINRFGDPEVFEIENIEKPKLSEGKVLIKVKTVSINPIDWKQRNGNLKLVLGSPFPIVLGYDICGEVVEVGENVSKFKPGDILFGVLDNKYGGALAEYAVGTEHCFTKKPSNISCTEAAAFPMVSLTALQALRDIAKIKPGHSVLIHGASGGVGHIALQVAKNMGATIDAVASEKSREFTVQFKPDNFIDYTKQEITKIESRYEVFFDVIGNLSFPKVKHLLKPGGVYINLNYVHSITKIPINLLHQLFSRGKKAKTLLMKHSSADLELIANWIKDGKLQVHIDKSFRLEEIKQAHEYAQQGHNKGKNIVVISE